MVYLRVDGWQQKELSVVIHGAEKDMILFLNQTKSKNKTNYHSEQSEESLFYIYNLKLKKYEFIVIH